MRGFVMVPRSLSGVRPAFSWSCWEGVCFAVVLLSRGVWMDRGGDVRNGSLSFCFVCFVVCVLSSCAWVVNTKKKSACRVVMRGVVVYEATRVDLQD